MNFVEWFRKDWILERKSIFVYKLIEDDAKYSHLAFDGYLYFNFECQFCRIFELQGY